MLPILFHLCSEGVKNAYFSEHLHRTHVKCVVYRGGVIPDVRASHPSYFAETKMPTNLIYMRLVGILGYLEK